MTVQLMDATGRSIEVRKVSAGTGVTQERFDVSKLAAGFYHVAVTDSKHNSFVKRIVVL